MNSSKLLISINGIDIPIDIELPSIKMMFIEEIEIDKKEKKGIKKGYKKIKENDTLINEICCICLDSFKMNEYKRELECQHIFHKKCCDGWITQEHTCPICRKKDN